MLTDSPNRENPVKPRSLWFGLATSATAWVALGCTDIVLNWRACTFQQDYGIPPEHPAFRVAISAIAWVCLVIAVVSGLTSYRNWRRVATGPGILETQAVERREFMAVMGVIVSITMGIGILLLALPPFFLNLCWRAR
ncbi:MAG: hypothetical protein ACRD3S_13440 [Terracidiphilus sp.]